MANTFKIDALDPQAQADVIRYAKNHSLRETERYIRETYGLELSYVSVRSLLARFKSFNSDAEIRLKNRIILEAEEVINRFNDLYQSEKSNKGKLAILSREAEFIKELFKNLPDIQPTQVKEITETALDWQKAIDNGNE